MEKNHIITKEQSGFLRNQECMGQVLSLLNKVHLLQNKSGKGFVAFLDITKAYDSVNHDLLFRKLEVMNVPHTILNFIKKLYSNSSLLI